jgi:carbonic anhydrase
VISAESLRTLYRPATSSAAAVDDEAGARLAIITCMDPRLRPERSLGIDVGDAYVIRNAGGRASADALRSLAVASAILGADEVAVIHHTGCRMLTLTGEDIRSRLGRQHGVDAMDVDIDFMTFSSLETSVVSDVTRVKESAFLPETLTVSGFVCDTASGRLERVPVPGNMLDGRGHDGHPPLGQS